MKKNLNKIFAATSAAVVATGIVGSIPSLVSCSTSQNKKLLGDEFDKEYGIDKATCITLADDFQTQVFNQIDSDVTKDEYQKAREKTRAVNSINSFRNMYTGNRDKSYTTISNAMIMYAMKAYKISLKRNINADWSIVRSMYTGAQQSVRIYMENNGFNPTEIDLFMEKADSKFNEIETSLKATYSDPVMALTSARAQVIRCFADMSEDASLLAAEQEMVHFFDSHDVKFNYTNKMNYFDNLIKMKGFVEGADISSYVNQLFTITDRDGHVVSFDTNIIPGYRFVPILTSIESDAKTNHYQLNIDWTCAKQLDDPIRQKRITAHYNLGPSSALSKLDMADKEGTLKKFDSLCDVLAEDKPTGMPYVVYLSPKEEQKALRKNYFELNEDSVELFWDDTDPEKPCYYDELFKGTVDQNKDEKEPGFFHYIINLDQMIKSGMSIKVKDVDYSIRLSDYFQPQGESPDDGEYQKVTIHPVIRQFLNNCNIAANVKISKTSPTIQIEPIVSYTNGFAGITAEGDDNNDRIYCVSSVAQKTYTNFKKSPNAYYNLVNSYNSLRSSVNFYLQNGYSEETESAQDVLIFMSASYAMLLFFNGSLVISVIKNWGTTIGIIKIMGVLAGIEIAAQTVMYGWWIHKFKLCLDFENKTDNLNRTDIGQTFASALQNDAINANIAIANDDGFIRRDEYDTMKEKYLNSTSYTDFLDKEKPILERYNNLTRFEAANEYRNEILSRKIGVDEYKKTMKQFGPGSAFVKTFTILNFAMGAIDFFILVASFFVAAMGDPEPQVAAEGVAGANEDTARGVNESNESTAGVMAQEQPLYASLSAERPQSPEPPLYEHPTEVINPGEFENELPDVSIKTEYQQELSNHLKDGVPEEWPSLDKDGQARKLFGDSPYMGPQRDVITRESIARFKKGTKWLKGNCVDESRLNNYLKEHLPNELEYNPKTRVTKQNFTEDAPLWGNKFYREAAHGQPYEWGGCRYTCNSPHESYISFESYAYKHIPGYTNEVKPRFYRNIKNDPWFRDNCPGLNKNTPGDKIDQLFYDIDKNPEIAPETYRSAILKGSAAMTAAIKEAWKKMAKSFQYKFISQAFVHLD